MMNNLSDQLIALWKEQWEKALTDPLLHKLGHEMMTKFQEINQIIRIGYASEVTTFRETERKPQTSGTGGDHSRITEVDFEQRIQELEVRIQRLESFSRNGSIAE